MMPNERGSRLLDRHCPLHPKVEMVEYMIATDPPQYRYVCPACTSYKTQAPSAAQSNGGAS